MTHYNTQPLIINTCLRLPSVLQWCLTQWYISSEAGRPQGLEDKGDPRSRALSELPGPQHGQEPLSLYCLRLSLSLYIYIYIFFFFILLLFLFFFVLSLSVSIIEFLCFSCSLPRLLSLSISTPLPLSLSQFLLSFLSNTSLCFGNAMPFNEAHLLYLSAGFRFFEVHTNFIVCFLWSRS